jgi:hypothetical protein
MQLKNCIQYERKQLHMHINLFCSSQIEYVLPYTLGIYLKCLFYGFKLFALISEMRVFSINLFLFYLYF